MIMKMIISLRQLAACPDGQGKIMTLRFVCIVNERVLYQNGKLSFNFDGLCCIILLHYKASHLRILL